MSCMVLLSSVESLQTFSEVPGCRGEILHSRKQGICKHKTIQTGLNLLLFLPQWDTTIYNSTQNAETCSGRKGNLWYLKRMNHSHRMRPETFSSPRGASAPAARYSAHTSRGSLRIGWHQVGGAGNQPIGRWARLAPGRRHGASWRSDHKTSPRSQRFHTHCGRPGNCCNALCSENARRATRIFQKPQMEASETLIRNWDSVFI